MKILFLYNQFDKALKEKILLLQAHNAEVSTLSLLEYKLTENGESTIIEPTSKLEFLEKYTPRLRALSRILKRKKMLATLDDYDIIDIYKCEKSSLFIVDEIREKCYDYFVTLDDEHEKANPIIRQFYKYLYKKARFLLFANSADRDNFDYPDEEKSRLIYEGYPLIKELDKISDKEIFKASQAMGLDLEKDIIYCDMSDTLQRQITLINDILTLPTERLRESTFIFHLNAHDLNERQVLKRHLEEKNFDYLLIEAFITPKQSALLYKIANKAIILSNSPTLVHALYSKQHIYLYNDTKIDEIFYQEKFFLDTFENFKKQTTRDRKSIEEELYLTNKEKTYTIFSPDETIYRYIEVLKEV